MIARLDRLGVRFDRASRRALALGLEAAHSRAPHRPRRRRRHRARRSCAHSLVAAVRSAVDRHPRSKAFVAIGPRVRRPGPRAWRLSAPRTSAGSPALHAAPARSCSPPAASAGSIGHTTNPLSAVGSGLAVAARAGAVLRDLEFVQFHPTALAVGADPMPLATEALRGEGAILVDGRGERFMADVPGAELAPRTWSPAPSGGRSPRGETCFSMPGIALGGRFAERFPTVAATLPKPRARSGPRSRSRSGRRRTTTWAGCWRTARGRTTVAGLWACGEVAATGLARRQSPRQQLAARGRSRLQAGWPPTC